MSHVANAVAPSFRTSISEHLASNIIKKTKHAHSQGRLTPFCSTLLHYMFGIIVKALFQNKLSTWLGRERCLSEAVLRALDPYRQTTPLAEL